MRRMYTELVNDALTEYAYDASLAGLGYDFGSYDRGVFLAASGYNEKVRFLSFPCFNIFNVLLDSHFVQDRLRNDEKY